MKKIIAMAGVALVLNACGRKERQYDATGVFEATETTVYAEQSGALMAFNVEEGDVINNGKEVKEGTFIRYINSISDKILLTVSENIDIESIDEGIKSEDINNIRKTFENWLIEHGVNNE